MHLVENITPACVTHGRALVNIRNKPATIDRRVLPTEGPLVGRNPTAVRFYNFKRW